MEIKFNLKWTSPALDDLDEIIEYISNTNITYAIKIMDKIYEQVNKLDMNPEICRIVPELEKYGYLITWGLIPRPLGRFNWGYGGFVPPYTQIFQR